MVEKEDGGEEIGDDGGEQVPGEAEVEHHQKDDVEGDDQNGAEHPVEGIELDELLGAHELGAEGAHAGGEHIEVDERRAALEHLNAGEERIEGEQEHIPGKNGGERSGKDVPLVGGAVDAEPDDGVGHADRRERDDQVGGLCEQVGVAEFSRSKHAGIEGNEQKNKHLRAEGADCEDQRVGEQLFILVHTAAPFPFI